MENDTIMKTRGSDGRFIKGVSGNPSGKPPMPAVIKELLQNATPDAVELLIETMKDESVKTDIRVRCAETIIDRVLGKSVQPFEALFQTQALDMSEFTIDELKRLASYDEETENSAGSEE